MRYSVGARLYTESSTAAAVTQSVSNTRHTHIHNRFSSFLPPKHKSDFIITTFFLFYIQAAELKSTFWKRGEIQYETFIQALFHSPKMCNNHPFNCGFWELQLKASWTLSFLKPDGADLYFIHNNISATAGKEGWISDHSTRTLKSVIIISRVQIITSLYHYGLPFILSD